MIYSLLDGLLVLIVGWSMAALFFFLGIKDMSLSLARKLALMLALATPFMAYHVSAEQYMYQVTTVHEQVLEGSLGVKPGLPAPVRMAEFNIENPGVEHSVSILPLRSLSDNVFPAHVLGTITGPDHTLLLKFDVTFEMVKTQQGSRIKRIIREWREKTFSFTPIHIGQHRLDLIPVTVGIPELSFRVSDPTMMHGRMLAGLLGRNLLSAPQFAND